MRRTLMLDADDLVMVVKEDVVKQVDENRGEMNRTEFVNYLIQAQLKESYKQQSYVTKDEFQHFSQQITDLMHNFLQFFISYGMSMNRPAQSGDFRALSQQLDFLDKPDEENGGR